LNVVTDAINAIRFLSIDAVEKAKSGHPGMPMGCAPIVYQLYTQTMNYNPTDPHWLNRDRFVLSAGHGSMLLYSILHLAGFDVTMDDLKNFRQWGSKTPGHPEYKHTPGVETTTGPLGQGIANAVGLALAQAHLASRFNKPDFSIIDHYIYGICSDGDLMEGVSHESASLAGHLKLDKLIFFYDNNKISIDGKTDVSFSENIAQRFQAYGWFTTVVTDVNDLTSLESAIKESKKSGKPSLIITTTHIGYGSPKKQDTSSAHGSPLGSDEVVATRINLGWDYPPFEIPASVYEHYNSAREHLFEHYQRWQELFTEYSKTFPNEAQELRTLLDNPIEKLNSVEFPIFPAGNKLATRQASQTVINAISPTLTNFIGGSADLTHSNLTYQKGAGDFSSTDYAGRNLFFGVREHGMGALCNGMAIYGGLIPYCATFLMFADYMRPTIRLAGLMKLQVLYVFTHDSIGLGEDGPTHQPIEHYAALRSIPNLTVIRPADANETSYAYKAALANTTGPTALLLTRQGLPVYDRTQFAPAEGLLKGAYVLNPEVNNFKAIILASGSEVEMALSASDELAKEGIVTRVVSFPSWEIFEQQSEEYKESVFPADCSARVSVEMGISQGWTKYTGSKGKNLSIETFGASAPYEVILENYGFTTKKLVELVKSVVSI